MVEKGSEPTAGSADVAANGAPGVDDPVFFAAVQDTVDRVDADRAAEQHAEQGRRTAQIWVDQLAQTLGLSDDQRIAVTDLGIEIAQKVQELSIPEAEGEPADPRERSAQLLALSDECERRLGSVLDGTQMNAYRDLDNKMRFGFVLE